MPDSPRRILIVRLSHLGDVVHALPVFHALRAAHPEAEIGWAVQPEFAGLLDGLPGLARIFFFDRQGGAAAWPRLWHELREFAPEWAVDCQGNAKSAAVAFGSGARRRSGLHRSDWREPFASVVLTDSALPVGRPDAHAMDRMLALACHVAPAADAHAAGRTDPGLSESEIEGGRARLESHFPEPDSPRVILHLSSPGDVRSWPLGHFEALARDLSARGVQVLVLSGPEEEDVGRQLERSLLGLPRVRHWVGQRGLRALAAFFTAASEREARLVCCDSGPMHLAAACGLAVTSLAGPQDERRTGPWAPPAKGTSPGRHRSLRAEPAPACAPCLSRRCDHPAGPVCMIGIAPQAVSRALEDSLCG